MPLRSSLPNVPDVTAWNAAVLNHFSTVSGPFVSSLIWFGSPVMFWPTLLLLWSTMNGRPERHVKMPDTVQSRPIQLSPSGGSTTKFTARRWRTS